MNKNQIDFQTITYMNHIINPKQNTNSIKNKLNHNFISENRNTLTFGAMHNLMINWLFFNGVKLW